MVFHRTAIKLIQGILLMVIYANQLSAQIAIGEWRTHLPYQFTNIVMLTDDKAFCSSTGGLFYYDLTDNSLETLSKTDGLSDNGVVAMNWSEEDQLAILAYNSANLDIIRGNQIINMPDIMKKQITGDKTVYNIYFHNSRAYLSCGFGIVVIDLNKLEITDTYYIGDNGDPLKVNQVTSDALYFYAATDEGVRKAEISNAFLIDFNSWELIDDLPDPVGKYKGTVFYSGNVFVVYEEPAGTGDQVFFNNGSWEEITGITGDDCSEIRISGNNLLFTGEAGGVRIMNDEFEIVGSYTEGKPSSAIMDDTGILWIADNGQGLVKVGPGVEVKTIRPNGPFTSIAFDMESGGGLLYSVVGGITATYNNIFRAGILQTFRDQLWKYNFKTEYKDLISLAVDPKDPEHVYAASWGYGLVEYREGVPEMVYDETNSTLQNAVPGSKVIRLGGLAYDEDDNLWMTNTGVPEPVSVLKSDGTWKSFRLNGILSDYPALGKVLMTKDNHLWGIIPKGGGLFAMNHNGTLENVEDDEYRLVSVADENGRTITNEVFSFAEDHNGNIWLGTNQGILVFYNPGSLFTNGSIYAREILVPR
ncbi:MAG: two-component regulator propeller domain-containing protein, partial [Bacteroidales bacterium]